MLLVETQLPSKQLALQFNGSPSFIELTNKRVVIGRCEGDVLLNDPLVSSFHAFIENKVIVDNNSTNGVIVNGKIVKSHRLKAGDSLLLGASHMSVCKCSLLFSSLLPHL
jgi:pSer/pThr/pTyr-binding forkhead associated (FHA) protein